MGYFTPIRQDEYPATDELQCIPVYIPAGDEYRALLAGFLAFLTNTLSYEDPDSAQADGIAAVFDTGYSMINWDGCGVPPECQQMSSELLLMGINATISLGNPMLYVPDTTMRFGGYFRQNTAAAGDLHYYGRFIPGGDWSYRITYLRNTTNGILKFEVRPDGEPAVESVTTDLRGALLANQYITGSFSLPESGEVFIICECTGSSSTGFFLPIASIELWQTAQIP